MTKKRILVVDDEVSITRLLKLNLEKTGMYVVHEENSGEGACLAAETFLPDMIITDVMMPDMGGGEVAARLRENPLLRKIPVVFLTAAVKKEELGGSQGVIGGRLYIAKPLDLKGVLAAIERVLGK
jgi:two-component system, OmpR family, phosphate regulon response regulator PhoB